MQEEILEDLNHNIYTPLNGLCGLIYLAREHADHKEKVIESLDKMEEAVRMLKDKTGLCFQKIREEEKIKGEEDDERNVEKSGIVPMHFLIAEDNEMNAEILTAILRLENHTVTWAKNGQEAVRFFESSKEKEYQMILMDLCMPVMNGYKAAKIIRELEREDAKTVPILACSANIFPEDKEKAKKSGMDGFIEKPIYIEQLKKEIIRVVGI